MKQMMLKQNVYLIMVLLAILMFSVIATGCSGDSEKVDDSIDDTTTESIDAGNETAPDDAILGEEEIVYDDEGAYEDNSMVSNEEMDQEASYTAIESASKGETVAFGTDSGQPMAWIVLDIQEDKVLLITKDIIELGEVFIYSKDTWATCSFRNYLNSDFMEAHFSADEIQKIIPVITEPDTEDQLFLISKDDAKIYFANDNARVASFAGTEHHWGLRPSGTGDSYLPFVNFDGSIHVNGLEKYMQGYDEWLDDDSGIRPAIWVQI